MKKEIIDKIATLAATAFGLVAALAWNDAIKAIFLEVFGTTTNIPGMLVYAIVVTVIAVAVIIWLAKLSDKK